MSGAAVFDLDAAAAARREAAGEPFRFVFHGQEFTCLPAKEWPIQVSEMLTQDMVEAVRLILGAGEQADAFLALNPTMGDVESLMTAIAEFSGFQNAGE